MEILRAALNKSRNEYGSVWTFPQEPASDATPSGWSTFPRFEPDLNVLRSNRIVTVDRLDPACRSFDMLRTKLMQKVRHHGWKSIVVTSPTPGCGKSVTSTNLAFSMANQQNCRTLLVDLDLRRPQVANLLGIDDPLPVAEMLEGKRPAENFMLRCADNLAVISNRAHVELPAELLQHPTTSSCVTRFKNSAEFDVVIFDMPPLMANDDTISFLPNVDCALLVLEADLTTPEEADMCEYELSQATNVAGVVLNKCRFSPDSRIY